MPAKVIDASVLAAFAFAEPKANEAAGLMKNSELYAPTILPYELCSVARKKILAEPAYQMAIQTALREVLRIPLELVEVPAPELLPLALATGLSVYDAAYLYLSRQRGYRLVTFDRRLAAAV